MGKLVLTKPSVGALTKGLVTVRNLAITKSPILLTIVGVGGVITTGVMAYKAGIKVNQIVTDLQERTKEAEGREPTFEEKAMACWKTCVPPVVSGGLTIAAIVGSAAISEKRRAALAGLYAVSEAALKEYQDKTEEIVGTKKEQAIRDAVNTDYASQMVVDPSLASMAAGDVIVKEKFTGRIFASSADKIRRAAIEINEQIQGGDYCASLNEFYSILGWDQNDIGDECGWNLDHLCRPYFTHGLTSEMRPVLVLDWDRNGRPIPTYRDI